MNLPKMKHFVENHRASVAVVLSATVLSLLALGTISSTYVSLNEKEAIAAKENAKSAAEAKKLLTERLAREAEMAARAKAEAEKKSADEAARAKAEADARAKAAAEAAAQEAQAVSGGVHADPASPDVLVNKTHPLSPLSYVPSVTNVACDGNTITVSVAASADLTELCSAAMTAGVPLAASSAYRSYSAQVSTYNYWVSIDGSNADSYSAKPGYSEHQTGFAIDFMVPGGAKLDAFTNTAQQQWLAANAWRFGFIQRYTAAGTGASGYVAESWHLRYVGRETAASYTSSGATSLEQFWGY